MSLVERLSAAFGHQKSKTLPKILDRMFSKEELRILTSLPSTPAEIGEKFGEDESKIVKTLQNLYMRGVVVISDFKREKPVYSIPSDAGLCIDLTLFDRRYSSDQELLDMLDKFHNEEYIQSYDSKEEHIFRVIPVEKEIQAPPSVILPYEKISEIVKDARIIVVQQCPCRTRARRCDNPQEICLSLDHVADYILSRGIGREVSKEEAMALLNQAENLGLVHQTTNTSKVDVVCNCCTCCCSLLSAYVHFGKKMATIQSRYRAAVNHEACNSCGLCLARCHFGALSFENGKPFIWKERCMGCGLCASKCPVDAISLRPVQPENHIPVSDESYGYSLGKLPRSAYTRPND